MSPAQKTKPREKEKRDQRLLTPFLLICPVRPVPVGNLPLA